MGKVANDTIMAETIAEIRGLARQRLFWIGLLSAGFVIGLTGPFGTYNALPPPIRIAYWMFIVTTTFGLGYMVSFAISTIAEGRGLGARTGLGIGAVAASIPVTVWLAGFHVAVFSTPFWAGAFQLLPYVVVICLAVAALSEAVFRREVLPVSRPPSMPKPTWLDQLPHHLGTKLISLHAQDHYVRAETELGGTMIRTTLHDAANDLGDYGVRLHRSWWVARRAIKAYRYRNGAPVVVLQDGRELPVGRTYRRSVKEALK